MQSQDRSNGTPWAGRVMSAVPAPFLLAVQLGDPERVIIGLGIVLLACAALHLVPQRAERAVSCRH